MASFDAGTMNWLHSVVFMNEPKFLELCGQEMRAAGVKPEIEVFDMGMLNTAKHYLKTGVLDAPAHFQLCLGAPGGMEATTESLVYLVNHLPENCTWSTFGIGRGANEITLAALAMGGNIRSVWRTMSITIRDIGPGQPAVYRPGEAGGRRVRQGAGYPGGGSCYFGGRSEIRPLVKGRISLVEKSDGRGCPQMDRTVPFAEYRLTVWIEERCTVMHLPLPTAEAAKQSSAGFLWKRRSFCSIYVPCDDL